MSWKIVAAILRKDLLDATRDARVLMALIVPIGIAIFYNFIFDDETPRPNATIAFTTEEPSELPDMLETAAGDAVDLTFDEYDDVEQVRERVADDEADIGLALPAGFDAAVQQGESPPLDVILPEDPGLDSEYVLSALMPVLWDMAGRAPPASIQLDTSLPEEGSPSVIDELGPRTYVILSATLLFVSFVAILAMPVTLTEEVEKRTIEALILIASYIDVIIAKALLGVLYVAVGVPLMLWLTGRLPENLFVFAGAAALISVTLIGFGLFIGVLFRNANQLNTWAGVIMIPVMGPAFVAGAPVPDSVATALVAHPVYQAMRLMVNGMAGEPLFANAAISWLVIAAWCAAGYGLLGWRISSRDA